MFNNYLPTVTALAVGQLPTDEHLHVDGFCVGHEVVGHFVEHISHSLHFSCVHWSHESESAV